MSSFLQNVSLFSGLSNEDYDFISNQLIEESYDKGQNVFSAGDPSDNFYLLKKGRVKLYNSRSGTQKEETVCIIKAFDSFCLSPVLNHTPFHIHAKALEPSLVFVLPSKALHELIDRSHPFAKLIIRFLAKKECDLCEEICDLSLSTTKERLAKFLFQGYQQDRKKTSFSLDLNQSDIASYLGTVRETVSRDLASLKKAGIIDFKKGKMMILRPNDLAQLANACVRNGIPFPIIEN